MTSRKLKRARLQEKSGDRTGTDEATSNLEAGGAASVRDDGLGGHRGTALLSACTVKDIEIEGERTRW